MPFIEELLRHRSVAIVGLAKNTGKTVCLNYVLQRLNQLKASVAVTSIGVDGEGTDRVTQTPKPSITLYPGMTFVTSETHYNGRKLLSEITHLSRETTSLGRLVTARVITQGKCLLSGPAQTAQIRALTARMQRIGIQTTVVDGALSRLSLASPAVTDGMVLATGAAYSTNLPLLVQKTRFVKELIDLPQVSEAIQKELTGIESGVWAVSQEGQAIDLNLQSVLLAQKEKANLLREGNRLYVSGVVSDSFLDMLRQQRKQVTLIVTDFSRVFVKPETFKAFLRGGNRIECLLKTKLLAVTVNPYAPSGYTLNSDLLCRKMQEALQIPVYNIKQLSAQRGLTA